MERFGFVGLPNSGKSSLFNALTGGGAVTARYAFATKDANTGVARVPDHRLDALAVLSKSKNVVPATVQVVDIGGLAEGANRGEGLGNRFLGGIRDVEAIVYVLRAFIDDDVIGSTDPLEQLHILELELALADLETVERQIDKRRKAAKTDKSIADEIAAADSALKALSDGTPLYRSQLSAAERELLGPWFLLTNKPVLAVVNVSEADLARADEIASPVAAELTGAEIVTMCVELEAQAAQLDVADRAEMLDALGVGEGALTRLVRAAYHRLGLRTFLTTGDKESRAWTFRAGAKAPECAGVIHTDLQRGFIKAEVIHWDELIEIGSWAKARDVGRLRIEGKDYEVIDGDVLEIRFNV